VPISVQFIGICVVVVDVVDVLVVVVDVVEVVVISCTAITSKSQLPFIPE